MILFLCFSWCQVVYVPINLRPVHNTWPGQRDPVVLKFNLPNLMIRCMAERSGDDDE